MSFLPHAGSATGGRFHLFQRLPGPVLLRRLVITGIGLIEIKR